MLCCNRGHEFKTPWLTQCPVIVGCVGAPRGMVVANRIRPLDPVSCEYQPHPVCRFPLYKKKQELWEGNSSAPSIEEWYLQGGAQDIGERESRD